LAETIPNLQRYERAKIVATPDGSELPYYRIAALYFEDMEQLEQSLASEEGQATVADVRNFATGGATFYFSEVDS
jgi:uncharacterized protein (TIGR02118 family)